MVSELVMFKILELLYAAAGRLGILDAKLVMHAREPDIAGDGAPNGYEIAVFDQDSLAGFLRNGRAPQSIGNPQRLDDPRLALIVAISGGRVVSFVWIARDLVAGDQNFSRAVHLGTSVAMPEGTSFVFNVWTDPEHRGKRLISVLLHQVTARRMLGTRALLTMIDWTNRPSIRAFEHFGMTQLGTICRLGRGRLQLSLVPKAARQRGYLLADAAPGWKFAID
jgi:hypothetical protein